ncbi:MAG: response regulator transcription factor [Eubacteriales bacterium]|nr:response regulator transcription factor [Eubacteriales bacterium]
MKLLIVEDDLSINTLLFELLSEIDSLEISQAFYGVEAENIFNSDLFDIVILDLMLPLKSGEDLIPIFREKGADVIVITAKSDVNTLVEVLELGASDYIAKPFKTQEVLARVKRVMARRDPTIEEWIQYESLRLNPHNREAYVKGQLLHLTQTEFDLLRLFISDPTRVFTKSQIYEAIWGEPYLGDNTISVHLSRLRSKLQELGFDRALKAVWGVGWKLR